MGLSSTLKFRSRHMRRPTGRRFITTRVASEAARLVYTRQGSPILQHFGPAIRTRQGHCFINESPANDMAVWRNDEQILISIRGSAHETDWTLNNLPIALNYMPARFLPALKFIQEEIDWNPNLEPLIIGHSLGGALAQLVSTKLNVKAVTFNAPPMRSIINGRLKFEIGLTEKQQESARDSSLVTNYSTTFDPVSRVPGLYVGQHKLIQSQVINPLSAHFMDEVCRSLTMDANSGLAEEEH